MELIFISSEGDEKVVATGDDIFALKDVVRADYKGDETLMWSTGVGGKAYNERVPKTGVEICDLNDSSQYIIR